MLALSIPLLQVIKYTSCRGGRSASANLWTDMLQQRKEYATGQYLGKCTGHTRTIHDICFSAPSSPQVICSCSGDGTIRDWDIRSFKQGTFCRIFERNETAEVITKVPLTQESVWNRRSFCQREMIEWQWMIVCCRQTYKLLGS